MRLKVLAPLLMIAAAACGKDATTAADGTGTGPASSLKCKSSGKNAWDTFGVKAFVAVNESIFTEVGVVTKSSDATKAAELGESFGHIGNKSVPALQDDVNTFKGKLAAFLVFVYGGPAKITYTDKIEYVGNNQDMKTAHTGLAITSDQYDKFVGDVVVTALTENGVTSDDIGSCFAPAITGDTGAAFKASIVGK